MFETIRPGLVEDEGGRAQARHINVCLFARGLLHELYTRIYFAGDPGLAGDPLLGCVPEDRRRTLIASPDGGDRDVAVRYPPSGRTRNRVLRAVSSGS